MRASTMTIAAASAGQSRFGIGLGVDKIAGLT